MYRISSSPPIPRACDGKKTQREKKKRIRIDGEIKTEIEIVLFKLDAMYVRSYGAALKDDLSLFASEVQSPGFERCPDTRIKSSVQNEI
jgi:hypothetical protein